MTAKPEIPKTTEGKWGWRQAEVAGLGWAALRTIRDNWGLLAGAIPPIKSEPDLSSTFLSVLIIWGSWDVPFVSAYGFMHVSAVPVEKRRSWSTLAPQG